MLGSLTVKRPLHKQNLCLDKYTIFQKEKEQIHGMMDLYNR
jgi:hypothetical protein